MVDFALPLTPHSIAIVTTISMALIVRLPTMSQILVLLPHALMALPVVHCNQGISVFVLPDTIILIAKIIIWAALLVRA
jgi:hypothetical protein